MATRIKSKYQKCSVFTVKFNQAEKIQDLNSDAIASELKESATLDSIITCLDIHDSKDSVMGNEPLIEQAKKLIQEAKKHNNYQYEKDHAEQILLDNVVPMFPESRMA